MKEREGKWKMKERWKKEGGRKREIYKGERRVNMEGKRKME